MAKLSEENEEKISAVCTFVKKKKQLSGISDETIKNEMNRLLKREPNLEKNLSKANLSHFEKNFYFRKTVKAIRKTLHKTHGVFQIKGLSERKLLLKELKERKDKRDLKLHEKLLSTSLSTKERNAFYPTIYKEIFSITSKPRSILDLGSGLNPISFPFMFLKSLQYVATEISENEIAILNEYFELMKDEGLNGKAIPLDLKEKSALEEIGKISSVDLCLMLKLFDSTNLSKKKRYIWMENMIKNLKSEWLVVSFPTKTLSQKAMKVKERRWFELMLRRINLEFHKIEESTEVFYIIKMK